MNHPLPYETQAIVDSIRRLIPQNEPTHSPFILVDGPMRGTVITYVNPGYKPYGITLGDYHYKYSSGNIYQYVQPKEDNTNET